jgi:hypothetical protein
MDRLLSDHEALQLLRAIPNSPPASPPAPPLLKLVQLGSIVLEFLARISAPDKYPSSSPNWPDVDRVLSTPDELAHTRAWAAYAVREIVFARVMAQWHTLCTTETSSLDSVGPPQVNASCPVGHLPDPHDNVLLAGALFISDLRAELSAPLQSAATYITASAAAIAHGLHRRGLILSLPFSVLNSVAEPAVGTEAAVVREASDTDVMWAVQEWFVRQEGYIGPARYEDVNNSFVDEVIRTRKGLPIVLCLVRVGSLFVCLSL